jgi:hypothetical protein
MCNPVSAAFPLPDPNNRFNVAEGEAVSFPAASACQLKNSLMCSRQLDTDPVGKWYRF